MLSRCRLAALALAGAAGGLAAQMPVRGRVVDATTRLPIAGAEVAMPFAPSVFTDSAGQFVFAGPRPRSITLLVRKLGYAPRRLHPEPVDGDSTGFVVVLDHLDAAQQLPTVTTTIDALVPLQYQFTHRYDDFFLNKKATIDGAFYTRAQIDSLGGVREAVEHTPGVRVRVDRFLHFRPFGVSCGQLALRIDGRKASWAEFDLLPSDAIELLEVHKSGLDAPGVDAGGGCGVVWVFTR